LKVHSLEMQRTKDDLRYDFRLCFSNFSATSGSHLKGTSMNTFDFKIMYDLLGRQNLCVSCDWNDIKGVYMIDC